jgi:hypothetical protein
VLGRIDFPNTLSAGDLVQDCRVFYLGVFCQQEGFAEDYCKGAVAFEGQE